MPYLAGRDKRRLVNTLMANDEIEGCVVVRAVEEFTDFSSFPTPRFE
jgi:hypothetical protein